MRNRHGYLLVVLVFVLAACSGQLDADMSVSGVWQGTINNSGNAITLQLSQSSTSVSGTIVIANTSVDISGTFARGLLSMSGETAAGPLGIEASVNGDSMQGTVAATTSTGAPVSSTFEATR